MIIMLIGVGIATMTELKPSLVGLITAFSGIFMTAIYQIVRVFTTITSCFYNSFLFIFFLACRC